MISEMLMALCLKSMAGKLSPIGWSYYHDKQPLLVTILKRKWGNRRLTTRGRLRHHWLLVTIVTASSADCIATSSLMRFHEILVCPVTNWELLIANTHYHQGNSPLMPQWLKILFVKTSSHQTLDVEQLIIVGHCAPAKQGHIVPRYVTKALCIFLGR